MFSAQVMLSSTRVIAFCVLLLSLLVIPLRVSAGVAMADLLIRTQRGNGVYR